MDRHIKHEPDYLVNFTEPRNNADRKMLPLYNIETKTNLASF